MRNKKQSKTKTVVVIVPYIEPIQPKTFAECLMTPQQLYQKRRISRMFFGKEV